MDPDLNKYDLYHRVTHHSRMSDKEWEDVYREAWNAFYSPEHLETILRRTGAIPGVSIKRKIGFLFEFFLMYTIEGLTAAVPPVVSRKSDRFSISSSSGGLIARST